MNILSGSLLNLRILSVQTGQTIGTTLGPVIQPDNLQIKALYCQTGTKDSRVILVTDIRQLSPGYIVIDSEDEIQDPKEIIRLQQIIETQFSLIGINVVTESGIRLGKVIDFSLDAGEYLVRKIHVKQSIFKSLLTDQLIIDRDQIIDVQPKQLIVREATAKNREHAIQASPVPTK